MDSRSDVLPEPLPPHTSVRPPGISSSACSTQRTFAIEIWARLIVATWGHPGRHESLVRRRDAERTRSDRKRVAGLHRDHGPEVPRGTLFSPADGMSG
jgi:hypothetical protein